MDLDDLLKSIREEGPSKGGSISPAKFFGEDRYETYLQEITSSGTVDGEQLSPSDRKEAFKKRNDKIGFQNFVDKVLEKKKSKTYTEESESQKSLPGGGAIVKSPKPSLANFIKPVESEKTGESENNQEILKDILKNIISIRESLGNQKKLEDKNNKKERKDSEKDKRSKKENKLESNVFKGIKKSISKVLAPVKGMFDKILNYLSTVFLGAIAVKIFDWFTDEKNKEKISTVFRFIKDWWPSLLGALILFGGALLGPVGLIVGITGLAVFFIPKLIDATKQLLGFGSQTEDDAKKAEKDLKEATDDINVDSILPEELKEADKKLEETKNLKEPVQMNKGGSVPGSGPNKDTVPAMLAPGEFVMSRGAVSKFGMNTMKSMNAAGGGSGIPSLMGNGLLGYSQGGSPGTEPGGRNSVRPEPSNGGRAWWDFMGWAGTGNKTSMNEKTSKESSSSSSGGGSIKGLSGQDFRDLAFIVSAEAQRGTNDEYGVAAAVLNRVADPSWPNTIKAVGSQAGQFEAVYKGLAKDDPELAEKLGSSNGQAKIVKALEMLKGRTDFKGTSQYANMGPGDVKFSSRGNFYHYKEQKGKNDPPPAPLPSYYTKFIGTGGPSVTLADTNKSSGSSSIASSSSSSGAGSIASSSSSSGAGSITSATQKPKISPPTLKSATATISNLRDMINSDFMESPESGIAAGNDIPEFAADAMNSINKIKTLGVV
jgi:hypothetical protein